MLRGQSAWMQVCLPSRGTTYPLIRDRRDWIQRCARLAAARTAAAAARGRPLSASAHQPLWSHLQAG